MVTMHEDDHFMTAKLDKVEARIVIVAADDGDVNLVVQELVVDDVRIAAFEEDLHQRVFRVEGAEQFYDEKRADSADAQLTRYLIAFGLQNADSLLFQREYLACDQKQRLAGVGELQAAWRTQEKLDLVCLLQRLHLRCHSRLADAQQVRRLGETQFAPDRIK